MGLIDELNAIGDAVREKTGTTDKYKLADMPTAILSIQGGGATTDIDDDAYKDVDTYTWERPSGWFDLDAIADATADDTYILFNFEVTDAGENYVTLYSLVTNGLELEVTAQDGTVTTLSADTTGTSSYYTRFDLNGFDAGIYMCKATPLASTNTVMGFHQGDSTMGCGAARVLETIICCPNVTAVNATSYRYGTLTTQRIRIKGASKIWRNAANTNFYNLVNVLEIVFDADVDFSKTTSYQSFLASCYRLKTVKGFDRLKTATALTSVYYMLANNYAMEGTIDLTGFNFSRVTTAAGMMTNCPLLGKVIATGLDFGNCQTFASMFAGDSSLREIVGTETWTTSEKLTNISTFVGSCLMLQTLNVTGWVVNNVTTINSFATGCNRLAQMIGIEGWQITSKCTNAAAFANNCNWLQGAYDLRGWDVSGITTFQMMWANGRNITRLDMSGWTNDIATNVNSMCSNMYKLEYVGDISGLTFGTSMTTNPSAFTGDYSLRDLSTWQPRFKITGTMQYFLRQCYSLEGTVDLSKADLSGVTHWGSALAENYKLGKIIMPDEASRSLSSKCVNFDSSFYNDYCLLEIENIELCDTSGATTMASCFNGLRSMESLNISTWTNPKATNMAQFMAYMASIEDVDVSAMTFEVCTTVQRAFYGQNRVKRINLSGWTGAKVTTYANMCANDYCLEEIIGMENLPATSCTDCTSMLQGCGSLEVVNLPNFNRSSGAINQSNMLNSCYNVRKINAPYLRFNSGATNTNTLYLCYGVQEFDFGANLAVSTNLTMFINVAREQWVALFNRLPSVSRQTLTIGGVNKAKLTDDDLAIATGKGWNVA